MRTVLIVCHANTCRSVMAHVVLERMLAEHTGQLPVRNGHHPVRVRSAGIGPYARDGSIPSLDARIVLREVGIRLDEETIVSTALRYHPELLAEADLILTMTADQKAMLDAFPEATGRPHFTLAEFAGEAGDVADPVGQGEETYRACLALITRHLERSFDRLLAAVATPR